MLQENGYINYGFSIQEGILTAIDAALGIRNALQNTLPIDVDFEIFHSIHTSLSKPPFAPGQDLNGAT